MAVKQTGVPLVLRVAKTNGMPILCFTGEHDVSRSFSKDDGPTVKCAWFAPKAGGGLAIWFWDESWRSVLRRTRAVKKGVNFSSVRNFDDLLRIVKQHRPAEYRVVRSAPRNTVLAATISEMRG